MSESSEEHGEVVSTEVPVEQPAKITTTTEVDATPETAASDATVDAGDQEAQPAHDDE